MVILTVYSPDIDQLISEHCKQPMLHPRRLEAQVNRPFRAPCGRQSLRGLLYVQWPEPALSGSIMAGASCYNGTDFGSPELQRHRQT